MVGSGAGGGVVAGELAQRGRDVLLLEIGPHRTAADFTRWEAKATHDLFWPLRLAPLPNGEVVAFLAGRCVGGTTTINTKVALRAHERDVAKWHLATGLTNERGESFAVSDLDPYYDRVERYLGVRERSDWRKSVHTVERGFHALGAELEPVRSYTDVNCTSCGSCLQGCATNAGKSTMNTYIHEAWARGLLELRADAAVERVLIEDTADGPQATGVEYVDPAGDRHTVNARRRGRRGGHAEHAAAPAPLGSRRRDDSDRKASRDPPDTPRVRALRRAAGRAHGLSDHRALHGPPARRERRLRDRGDDDPGSDLVRDDALRRAGAALGRAAGRGGQGLPPLDRPPRARERRQQLRGRGRRVRRPSASTSSSVRTRSSGWTRRPASAARCSRRRERRRSAGRGSPRRTCRGAAGWATTRSAPSSTGTASRTM